MVKKRGDLKKSLFTSLSFDLHGGKVISMSMTSDDREKRGGEGKINSSA